MIALGGQKLSQKEGVNTLIWKMWDPDRTKKPKTRIDPWKMRRRRWREKKYTFKETKITNTSGMSTRQRSTSKTLVYIPL